MEQQLWPIASNSFLEMLKDEILAGETSPRYGHTIASIKKERGIIDCKIPQADLSLLRPAETFSSPVQQTSQTPSTIYPFDITPEVDGVYKIHNSKYNAPQYSKFKNNVWHSYARNKADAEDKSLKSIALYEEDHGFIGWSVP